MAKKKSKPIIMKPASKGSMKKGNSGAAKASKMRGKC